MKSLCLLTIFLSLSAFSKPLPIIKCLGKEENFYHQQKISGPFYNLNQTVISEFLQMEPTVILAADEFEEVCKNKKHPSVRILEALLVKKDRFFSISQKDDELKLSIAKESINVLVRKAPDIFWEFISGIQALSPKAHCLNRYIPEIKKLKTKNLYLEEELTQEVIFSNQLEIKRVFKKLEDINSIFERCAKETPKK